MRGRNDFLSATIFSFTMGCILMWDMGRFISVMFTRELYGRVVMRVGFCKVVAISIISDYRILVTNLRDSVYLPSLVGDKASLETASVW